MPINPLGFLQRAFAAKHPDVIVPPRLPPVLPSDAGDVRPNSTPAATTLADALDRTPRTMAPTRVNSATAATAPAAKAKSGDPLSWAAKATGFAVKTAGVLGGFGLVIFGGMKVLAAMTVITGAGPLFATGVGLCVAGAAVYKLGGIISKAITG